MPSIQKRQAKLKESCDRCSLAKVKCDRSKPGCSRCSQKGFQCCYGYSRRAGRRNTSSHGSEISASSPSIAASSPRTPSLKSLPSPQFSHSPNSIDDSDDISLNYWTFPQPPEGLPDVSISMPSYSWSEHFYQAQNLDGSLTPFDCSTIPPYIPATIFPGDTANPPKPTAFTLQPTPIPTEPNPPLYPEVEIAPSPMSTSTPSSSPQDSSYLSLTSAIQEELTSLTSFASAMERKFDAVVRRRIKYRDVLHSLMEEEELEMASPRGVVAAPDVSEMAFYYSLAELRRRLKWLGEDVGNLVATTD